MPPQLDGFPQLQIQTGPKYTLSASEFRPLVSKNVFAKHFSQSQDPDAPFMFEISGLGFRPTIMRFKLKVAPTIGRNVLRARWEQVPGDGVRGVRIVNDRTGPSFAQKEQLIEVYCP
jgi:hypothetical protein